VMALRMTPMPTARPRQAGQVQASPKGPGDLIRWDWSFGHVNTWC
jgi:hypothetical protein